jgi:hypothetical protein
LHGVLAMALALPLPFPFLSHCFIIDRHRQTDSDHGNETLAKCPPPQRSAAPRAPDYI